VSVTQRLSRTLALRPLAAADSAQVLAWRNSPEVAAFMYSDHAIGPDEHAAWLKATLAASDRRYWVILLDGEGVGVAHVVRIDPVNRRGEWGFYLADPKTRGRGVGACVQYAVIEHAFGALGLNKLWCEALADNDRALALYESFGFRREALLRAHVWKAGRPHDVVGLGLLAADWVALRPASAERLEAKGWDLAGCAPSPLAGEGPPPCRTPA
jgi:UDP-4-amino-4,6-dideoxy-N-acetyl-beta-L-altrosamine N-acetyltransferase